MKVILNQDVNHLGEEGDVVEVKNGYARNYLLPKGFASLYNKANIALFKSREEAILKRKEEKRNEAKSLKEKLDALTLTITAPCGDSGKLFGSVTSQMLQQELAKEGFDIEKKKIEVQSHMIKMTGTYPVTIRLYENESAEIKLIVQSEKERAEKEKKAAKVELEKKAKEEAVAKEKKESEAVAKVDEVVAQSLTEEKAGEEHGRDGEEKGEASTT